jgi:hypothetical protein
MSNAFEAPVCVSLVLCNECIEDKRTNNKSLIGLFNAITVQSVPALHPRMVVLATITNASTTFTLSLVIRGPSGAEVSSLSAPFPAMHPLATYDIVFEFNGVTLEETGTYNADLLCDGSYLNGRRFDVMIPEIPNT